MISEVMQKYPQLSMYPRLQFDNYPASCLEPAQENHVANLFF